MSEEKEDIGQCNECEENREQDSRTERWRVVEISLVLERFRSLVAWPQLTGYKLGAELECSVRESCQEWRHRGGGPLRSAMKERK